MTRIIIFTEVDTVSIRWPVEVSTAGKQIAQAINESKENNRGFIFLIAAEQERVHIIKTDTIRRITIEKE